MITQPVRLHPSQTVADKAMDFERNAPNVASSWSVPSGYLVDGTSRSRAGFSLVGNDSLPVADWGAAHTRGRACMVGLVSLLAAGGWTSLLLWCFGHGGSSLIAAFVLLQLAGFALLLRLLKA